MLLKTLHAFTADSDYFDVEVPDKSTDSADIPYKDECLAPSRQQIVVLQTPTSKEPEPQTASDSSDVSFLRRQIAEMKREAVSLGLFDRPPPMQSPLLLRRGPLGDQRTVDRRPRQLLVTGFIADDKEDVLTHLLVSV
jgi:hypothetical protein